MENNLKNKIIKPGVFLLFMLLNCKAELSEWEKVEQLSNYFINSAINEGIFSRELEPFYSQTVGRNPVGPNHILVIKSFKIKEINLKEKGCENILTKEKYDCYHVTVVYTKMHYLDFDGNRKEVETFNGRITRLENRDSEYNDFYIVRKEANEYKIDYESNINSIMSEEGERKFLQSRKQKFKFAPRN